MYEQASPIARSLLLAVICLAASAGVAGTPARIWSNLDHVLVRCSGASPLNAAPSGELCDVVLEEVRRLSPYPADLVRSDSAAARSPRSLLIDAQLIQDDGLTHLQMSVRRAISIDDSEGARTIPPVALAQPASADSVRHNIATALARALPWRPASLPYRDSVRILETPPGS